MFNSSKPKKHIIAIVVLISIALVIALFYYFFFAKINNKIPTRGFFVSQGMVT